MDGYDGLKHSADVMRADRAGRGHQRRWAPEGPACQYRSQPGTDKPWGERPRSGIKA